MSELLDALSRANGTGEIVENAAKDAPLGEDILLSLVSGHADKYMFSSENVVYRDVRKEWLSEKYASTFRKIDVDQLSDSRRTIRIALRRTCDAVNDLELALAPDAPPIRSISVKIGGQVIDKIHAGGNDGDFETIVEALAAVHGRRRPATVLGARRFVPLTLAPFHSWNLLPLVALKWHDVAIHVEFSTEINSEITSAVELYGKVYFLSPGTRTRLVQDALTIGVAQCQWGESARAFRIRLSLNHPVVALVFWGFDKSKVTNVRLRLHKDDAVAYYDGPLDALERAKEMQLLGRATAACFIFFSSAPLWSDRQSTVNFSRIDYASLEIESTQELGENDRVEVRGITLQPLRIIGGMAGLAFSK